MGQPGEASHCKMKMFVVAIMASYHTSWGAATAQVNRVKTLVKILETHLDPLTCPFFYCNYYYLDPPIFKILATPVNTIDENEKKTYRELEFNTNLNEFPTSVFAGFWIDHRRLFVRASFRSWLFSRWRPLGSHYWVARTNTTTYRSVWKIFQGVFHKQRLKIQLEMILSKCLSFFHFLHPFCLSLFRGTNSSFLKL